jgi:hypothetical protein
MNSKDQLKDEVIQRLNILISLLLEGSSAKEGFSMSDKITKLVDLGVPSSDIAKILGKPLNYVTAVISQKKSRKKVKHNEQ